MNPHIWWYLSRASGIVAYLMLTATVLWGIALSARLFAARRSAWLRDLHRWLGGLTAAFLAAHLATLVADGSVHFGLVELFVPFAAEWNPAAVALGVVACWLIVAVQATSLAVKHLPKRWWRGIHLASYAAFWLTALHGILAGTDSSRPLYAITSAVAIAAVVMASAYRIVTRDRVARRPARRDGASSQRPAVDVD